MADSADPETLSPRERKRTELRERLRLGESAGTRVSHLDGLSITAEQELALNEQFSRVFRGKAGKDVLDYLRRMTVEYIGGPGINEHYLMHMEGSRYLFGIISARIDLGRRKA